MLQANIQDQSIPFALIGRVDDFSYAILNWLPPCASGGRIRLSTDRGAQQSMDPQLRVLQSYGRYPERYLRISRESWKYEKKSQTAFHSFTLINTAAVRYRDIRVRIRYQTDAGKVLSEQTIQIPEVIGPSTALQLNQLRVKGVPAAAEAAVLSLMSAVPQP